MKKKPPVAMVGHPEQQDCNNTSERLVWKKNARAL